MTRLLASSFIMLAAASAFAVDPYIGYIYPSGIQAGTTNRFIIGGQAIAGARNFRFSGGGINVLKVQPVPNFAPPNGSFQRKHLIKWLDGIAAGNREEPPLPTNDPHLDEWRSNSWWKVLGTLDEGQLAIVEYDLHVPKNALQSSPSLRQMSLVTIAADADAKPGCRSFVAWNFNGFSAPRPFYVTSARHVAEPLYVPPHRAQPEPPFVDLNDGPAVLDGQILPGSTDVFRLRLAGGRRYVFNVTARELQPYIGDAVPGFFNAALSLKGEQGEPVAFADDNARFRPDPLLEFSPPSDGTYRLEIRDVLYRGRFDFVYAISVGEAEETPRPKADGVVSRPGAVALKKFTVHSPGPRVLEVFARRRGSPLDAVLSLRKASGGPELARWDDVTNKVFVGTVAQAECDPCGIYDFKEAGDYIAEVTDRTGHGGSDYVWWLEVRCPFPDFVVYSTRSTMPLNGGAPLKMGFRIVRKEGFDGDVTLEFPDNLRVTGNVATSGVDTITSSLVFTGHQFKETHPVKIFAKAEIGGQTVRHEVVPCDEYEQAFAWHHLVPAESFLARAVPSGKKGGNKQKRKASKK